LLSGLLNRYFYILCLEAFMVHIHVNIIPIYPLLFIVWPLCLWLLIETIRQFKERGLNILAFSATFLAYLVATQKLMVERPEGIFFDLGSVPNMPLLSYVVLGEAAVLFLYEMFRAKSVKLNDVIPFISFASIIPWLAPLLVESVALVRWFIEGSFFKMTEGKCVGGAGFNDILFYYGGRNFIVSLALFSTGVLLLQGIQRADRILEGRRFRLMVQEADERWRINVWNDPIALLNNDERVAFLTAYAHLSIEEQKEILRNKILPRKGIILVDSGGVS